MAWFYERHAICTDGRNVGLLLARRDSRADCLVAAGSRGARARGGRTSVRGGVLEKPPRRCPSVRISRFTAKCAVTATPHPVFCCGAVSSVVGWSPDRLTGSIPPLRLVESVTVGWTLTMLGGLNVR